MTDFARLNSGEALVCQKEHRADCGVGVVWYVLLSDGYLMDCGSQVYSEARARTLADIINAGGAEQWQRLGKDALRDWRKA